MFVTRSKYNEVLTRAVFAESRFRELQSNWNSLVRRINSKGGEDFLNGRLPGQRVAALSADDIQRLIQLCHPDKHEGKPAANEMTAKLLKMKEGAQ